MLRPSSRMRITIYEITEKVYYAESEFLRHRGSPGRLAFAHAHIVVTSRLPSYLQSVLPPEVLLSILQFLPSVDKLRLRLTCRRMHELVGNPRVWSVASFDHDHFTSAGGRKVLDTILKLCAPGTRKLEVNTRGLMARFPWARFMKQLSSNLSHLSLVGVKISSKQLNVVFAFCPSLSHLKIELLPKTHLIFTELGKSLKSLELYIDDLFILNSYQAFHSEVIKSIVKDWVSNGCHPSQLTVSHSTPPTDECLSISSFISSLSDSLWPLPPPEARGQLKVVCLEVSREPSHGYPSYLEVVIENSECCVPATNCFGTTFLLAQSQAQAVCVPKPICLSHNYLKFMSTPFSDLTHLIMGSSSYSLATV